MREIFQYLKWLLWGLTDEFVVENAEYPLTTPTHDGTGEALHPDVFFNPEGWHGYQYWMAITPFHKSDSSVENPSILVSDDGNTWRVPEGLINPVVDKPDGGYNSDPELIVVNNIMYLFFRSVIDKDVFLNLMKSDNGLSWSNPTLLFTSSLDALELSPSIVRIDERYYMFTVNKADGLIVHRRESMCIGGNWVNAIPVNLTIPGQQPWHIDVIVKNDGNLLAVISTFSYKYIYLAESADEGLNWKVTTRPILQLGGVPSWDDKELYRACLVEMPGRYELWYSARNQIGQWHIGRTCIYYQQ